MTDFVAARADRIFPHTDCMSRCARRAAWVSAILKQAFLSLAIFGAVSSAHAQTAGECKKGERCSIYEASDVPGRLCLHFRGDNGEPINVQMLRTLNGQPKHFNYYGRSRCVRVGGGTDRIDIVAKEGNVHWRITDAQQKTLSIARTQ